MASESQAARTEGGRLTRTQGIAMAAGALLAGLAVGYFATGSPRSASPAQAAAATMRPAAASGATHPARMPSMDDMKRMADTQAAPLLEKLKSDPSNSDVLAQIAATYHAAHQFQQAAVYYGRAVDAAPKSVDLRTKLAASLYRGGDADHAIAQLNKALAMDPKNANALFDLGMIRLEGKQDGNGAVAAWQRLLRTNPQLSAERKAQVQRLLADELTTLGYQQSAREAQRHDADKTVSK